MKPCPVDCQFEGPIPGNLALELSHTFLYSAPDHYVIVTLISIKRLIIIQCVYSLVTSMSLCSGLLQVAVIARVVAELGSFPVLLLLKLP